MICHLVKPREQRLDITMAEKTILIVEDDPISLKLARDVLRAHGYLIEEATNGEDAIARASEMTLDLIVMDIRLPGMDGLEVTRRLKNNAGTREIPIIAVTAHAMPGDEEEILGAGCQAYLAKPLSFKEFVSTVKNLLNDVETV